MTAVYIMFLWHAKVTCLGKMNSNKRRKNRALEPDRYDLPPIKADSQLSNGRNMRNTINYFSGILLLAVMPAFADDIQKIPRSYQETWHSDDGAIITAVISDNSVFFIDEDRKKSHCNAKNIEKYTTGFLFRKEVVRVTCVKSTPREVRNLNSIFGTTYKISDTTWDIYLSKEDDFTMNIDDCLKPFMPCSRPVGFFYKE